MWFQKITIPSPWTEFEIPKGCGSKTQEIPEGRGLDGQFSSLLKMFSWRRLYEVRGGLCSEGTLSSVLRLQACFRVSFPEKKIEVSMFKDAMTGCGDGDLHYFLTFVSSA